jgi:hypothetical protein
MLLKIGALIRNCQAGRADSQGEGSARLPIASSRLVDGRAGWEGLVARGGDSNLAWVIATAGPR